MRYPVSELATRYGASARRKRRPGSGVRGIRSVPASAALVLGSPSLGVDRTTITPMAIISQLHYTPFDESDPDDFRPDSRWALLVDPDGMNAPHVDHITLIVEEIAPGDRIPLHTHPISEVIVILAGTPEVVLGDDTQQVEPGTVVFVPAGTPHGTERPVQIQSVFPPCSRRSGSAFTISNESGARNPARRATATLHDRRPGARRSLSLRSTNGESRASAEPSPDETRVGN